MKKQRIFVVVLNSILSLSVLNKGIRVFALLLMGFFLCHFASNMTREIGTSEHQFKTLRSALDLYSEIAYCLYVFAL